MEVKVTVAPEGQARKSFLPAGMPGTLVPYEDVRFAVGNLEAHFTAEIEGLRGMIATHEQNAELSRASYRDVLHELGAAHTEIARLKAREEELVALLRDARQALRNPQGLAPKPVFLEAIDAALTPSAPEGVHAVERGKAANGKTFILGALREFGSTNG